MRLIDEDALADEMAVILERNDALVDRWLAEIIEDTIAYAPIIDAVEVVRCKDCYSYTDDDGMEFCCSWSAPTEANGFCSDARKKDEY